MADKTVISAAVIANAYSEQERPISMHKKMYKAYPEVTVLTSLLTRLGDEDLNQPRAYWHNSEMLPNTLVLTGALASGDTAFTTSQYAYVRNRDVWYHHGTKQWFYVVDAAIDSTVTFTRKYESAAADVPAGETLIRLQSAYPENAAEIYPRMVVDTDDYNLVQQMVAWTRHSLITMNTATHFGGKGTKRSENNEKLVYDWRRAFELTILLGQKNSFTASGDTYSIQSTGGLVDVLYNGTNYFDGCNEPLTMAKLDALLTRFLVGNPDVRNILGVFSPQVYTSLTHMAAPQIRISSNATRYGAPQLKNYDGPISIDLMRHPLLGLPGLTGMFFLLDMDRIAMPYQLKPQLELNVEQKANLYTTDRMVCLATLRIANESRHVMGDRVAA